MADQDRAEHQGVKELLAKLEGLKVNNSQFRTTLDTLMKDLTEHMKHEEEGDLPKLEEKLGKDESVKLAKSFQSTKKFVPTHSHPSAPSKPPFETVAGLLAAPIDKLKDLFSKFPQDAST